ncbi:MAG: glycosyltransferase [Bdellovibrionota bacterium]
MKLSKPLVIEDPCQTSVNFLRARCAKFFAARPELRAKHVWYADHHVGMPKVKSGDIVDVVFFGGFVRRFLESGNWLDGRYRLWCLTGSVRDVMSKVLGIPVDAIGVIPREDLAPEPKRSAVFPRRGEKVTFVFGGRLSATKNLELLVRTVSRMQTELRLDVALVLSGNFDDRNHPDRGIRVGENYALKLTELIAKLSWTESPKLVHGLKPAEWIAKSNVVNPVYVNLSTYVYEDFDVSLAQAREAGWPAIVSDWGGHRDLRSDASCVLKIPPAMLGHSHEPETLTDLRARSLAIHLSHAIFDRPSKKTVVAAKAAARTKPREFEIPRVSTSAELDSFRRKFIEKVGPSVITLVRHGLDGFSYEAPSEKFFSAYRACFAAPFHGEVTAVLVGDFQESKNPAVEQIPRVCEGIVEERATGARQIVFVPALEVLHPMHSLVIANAREILVPFKWEHLGPLVKHWVRDLEIPARIFTVSARTRTGRRNGLTFSEVKR